MDIIDKICDESEFDEPIFSYSAEKLKTSPIRNYFVGKVIFLTGTTGFLGQLYLEKLLRCDVERVFILARAKKNQPAKERLKEIFDGIQFSRLKQHDPNFLDRITIIEGNLEKLRLDISDKDMQLLQDTVDIVIHAAADVRFNKQLHDLVLVNLRGTREMLHMAESFKKLQVFVYVSTAYSNCVYGKKIYERFYEPAVNPDDIIAYAERIQSCPKEMDAFEVITERFIKPWPNTYSFTKSLSEELVRRFGHKFPICVMRPTVVISTYNEPIPAWTNSIFGCNGAVVAAALGLCRISLCDNSGIFDIISADFVINGTLAAIWATNKDNKNRQLKQALTGTDVICHDANPQIYCIGTSVDYPITHYSLTDKITMYKKIVLFNQMIWVPTLNATTSLFLFKYLSIFYHLIPTVFFDFMLFLSGKKERIMPIIRKISEFTVSVAYFRLNEWIMDNSNMRNIMNRMSPIDHELFLCDGRILNNTIDDWLFLYSLGLRKYLIKETSLETNKSTYTKYKVMYFIHNFVRIGFYASQLLLIYALAKGLGIGKTIFG